MREIKSRGIRKDNSERVYGHYFFDDGIVRLIGGDSTAGDAGSGGDGGDARLKGGDGSTGWGGLGGNVNIHVRHNPKDDGPRLCGVDEIGEVISNKQENPELQK